MTSLPSMPAFASSDLLPRLSRIVRIAHAIHRCWMRAPRVARSLFDRINPAAVGQSVPPEQEIGAAIRVFRTTRPLCVVDGIKTNEGFGVSISFNASSYVSSGGGGTIEIALKTASLTFRPPATEGWSWADSIPVFIKENTESLTVKTGQQQTETRQNSHTNTLAAKGGGTVSAPLIGKASIEASVAHADARGKTQGLSTLSEVTSTQAKRWSEFMRDRSGFELRLASPNGEDLVRMNADLNRLSVLSPPEDVTVEPTDVRVTLSTRASTIRDGGLDHSFSIREATGHWAAIASRRNKKAVAELLFSKFLKPMQRPTIIWPPKSKRK